MRRAGVVVTVGGTCVVDVGGGESQRRRQLTGSCSYRTSLVLIEVCPLEDVSELLDR